MIAPSDELVIWKERSSNVRKAGGQKFSFRRSLPIAVVRHDGLQSIAYEVRAFARSRWHSILERSAELGCFSLIACTQCAAFLPYFSLLMRYAKSNDVELVAWVP